MFSCCTKAKKKKHQEPLQEKSVEEQESSLIQEQNADIQIPKIDKKQQENLELQKRKYSEMNKMLELERQQKGTYLYVINSDWLNSWANFITNEDNYQPGIICNGELLDSDELPLPRLECGKHYRALFRAQWKYLMHIYGADRIIILKRSQEQLKPDIYQYYKITDHKGTVLQSNAGFGTQTIDQMSEIKEWTRFLNDKINDTDYNMTGYMPNDSFQADDAILKEVRPVGLENPGLFCYANSIIQFLLTIEDVFILFQSKENKQLWQDMPMCRSLCSTTRGFSKEYRRTFRPSQFWQVISQWFEPNDYHDPVECLQYIIEQLDNELSSNITMFHIDPWERYSRAHHELLNIITGMICSRVTCSSCMNVHNSFYPFQILPLTYASSLNESLNIFAAEEKLVGEYRCENCKRLTNIKKQLFITHDPEFLMIQVKRFEFNNQGVVKIQQHLQLQEYLKLEQVSNAHSNYQLAALIEHQGATTHGHFLTFALRQDKWYQFDDTVFHEVSLLDVMKAEAYFILYRRIS